MKKLIFYCYHALAFLLILGTTSCEQKASELGGVTDKIPGNVSLADYSNSSLTVSWNPVEGATSYTVQLLESKDSDSWLDAYTTTSKSNYVFAGLEATRSYYVRVRANVDYAIGDWVYLMNGGQRARIIPEYGIVDEDFELPVQGPEPIRDIYPNFPEDWENWQDGHTGSYPTTESAATYASGEYMIIRWNTNSGGTVARRSGNAMMSQSNQNSILTMNADLPNGVSKLSFYIAPATSNDTNKGDFVVEYSQDAGESWTELARYQQSVNNQDIPWDRDMNLPGNYKEIELDLQGNVRFRFSSLSSGQGAGNNPGSRWAIDDIAVYQNLY